MKVVVFVEDGGDMEKIPELTSIRIKKNFTQNYYYLLNYIHFSINSQRQEYCPGKSLYSTGIVLFLITLIQKSGNIKKLP